MGHSPKHYFKIYGILLILLLASIVGPESGIKIVILITAFGIAVVKAYLVAVHFMHVNLEKKYISFALFIMVGFMFLFFFAVAPDVMNHSGMNWVNTSSCNDPTIRTQFGLAELDKEAKSLVAKKTAKTITDSEKKRLVVVLGEITNKKSLYALEKDICIQRLNCLNPSFDEKEKAACNSRLAGLEKKKALPTTK